MLVCHFRYLSSLYYGIKFRTSKKSRLFYHLMVNEDTDAALLRLFECFMEAGPQLILQIYIIAVETAYQDNHWVIGTFKSRYVECFYQSWWNFNSLISFFLFSVTAQIYSILSSLFSMAWSLVSYHRSLRVSLDKKANISIWGSFTQLLWHLFALSSRVLALALFASLYPYWFVVFCASHWGVMTLWIISMKTEFCENKYRHFCFVLIFL